MRLMMLLSAGLAGAGGRADPAAFARPTGGNHLRRGGDRQRRPRPGGRLARAAGLAVGAPISVPPGERSKSWDTAGHVLEQLLARIDRATTIIALGGGVVGDLAGIASAIALRGVDFVQIPTTLLAQVDAAVGGKTAINSVHGKNLIGAFHQPRLVLCDIDVLSSLPIRELRAGYAEIVKYGLIGDAPFFAWLEEHGSAALAGNLAYRQHMVAASVRAKARIVAADEKETSGERALLNLGHTFGHAIEAVSGYSGAVNHGEAVAIGLCLAFDLSARLGHCRTADALRVRRHLAAVDLPVAPDPNNFAAGDIFERMAGDKKAKDGKLTFVLAKGIGHAFRPKRPLPAMSSWSWCRPWAARLWHKDRVHAMTCWPLWRPGTHVQRLPPMKPRPYLRLLLPLLFASGCSVSNFTPPDAPPAPAQKLVQETKAAEAKAGETKAADPTGNMGTGDYGMLSPHYPCATQRASEEGLPSLRKSVLWSNLGNETSRLLQYMEDQRLKVLELHLINEVCHRNRRCGGYEFLAKMTVADYDKKLRARPQKADRRDRGLYRQAGGADPRPSGPADTVFCQSGLESPPKRPRCCKAS